MSSDFLRPLSTRKCSQYSTSSEGEVRTRRGNCVMYNREVNRRAECYSLEGEDSTREIIKVQLIVGDGCICATNFKFKS